MDNSLTLQSKIRTLVSDILREEGPGKLLHLTDQLFDSLVEIISPVITLDSNHKDSILQSGKALSPYWAAASIKDFKRTQYFMRGLLEAIGDLRTTHQGECIHIVYAGTGPFAVLALPVLFDYPGSEVKFTFIDIHPDSIRSLTVLLDKLRLTEHIEALMCADATNYSLPKDRKTHLVISETMQRALVREPQVGITLHLALQTDSDTIWIPESILVEATLVNKSKDMDRMMGRLREGETHFQPLGTLMDLTKTTAQAIVRHKDTDHKTLDEVTFPLPADVVPEFPVLTLMTTVHVYGSHRLLPHDASITLPHELHDLRVLKKTPSSVHISYRLGDDPGFECRFE